MTNPYSVNDHFVNTDPSIRALYEQLLSFLHTFGPSEEDAKKTSIHSIVNLHWQAWKSEKIACYLISSLIIKSTVPAFKKPSKFRQDEELKTWLKEAYLLSE